MRYAEAAFFTYWNESAGEHVDRFWQELGARGLPFERRDPARRVLERGRITSQVDYETVSDSVDDDRFDREERSKLAKMLAAYANGVVGRRARPKRKRTQR